MIIDVKRSYSRPCVTLSGPRQALGGIRIASTACLTSSISGAGDAQEIRLSSMTSSDNYSMLKIALLEEVLKLGFKPTSNISDDVLILSREVQM